ncbi:TIGR02391 family protein [Rhodohalobacter mucosus]|uniref:TIGR02391 family protein n=1 Tax=Rhodohalobacter mucosus TaxID=2079485 RepID=A0A316TT71_9BACT|nr:TIGR02391 family protein [Rhodohalobacter mucosus]PWN05452.1 TIGR02391 family protein [Rhodohalobacter mucosus]
MAEKKELLMSFDPHTIEHLGVKMYSNLPNALAELIANAYDADAETVIINLYDDEQGKRIQVTDDGFGMSFEDLNDKFLRIGRKRRQEGDRKSPSGKRKVTGRKGLGKLAFFGLAETIEIETITKDSAEQVNFTLSWNELIGTEGSDYKPEFKIVETHEKNHGTEILLKDLKRKSAFDKEGLAVSLSKLFNLFDNTFQVYLSLNNDEPIQIDEKLKFKNIEPQFEWEFPKFLDNVAAEYDHSKLINGKILSTEKPLKPGLRGITLFANGRLINAPEFFGVSESSHGYSYFTGWLEVDYVDDWEEDVISTDRQSLSWDLPKTEELRKYLRQIMFEIERNWREKRKEVRREKVQEKTELNIQDWFEKLPVEIRSRVAPIIDRLEDSELQDSEQAEVVKNLHEIAPEYPYYHWRHLHPAIHEVAKDDYEKEDYLRAAIEALKQLEELVKQKSGINNRTGFNLMETVFGSDNSVLLLTENTTRSEKNIENGQESLSKGIMMGFRNPASHDFKKDIFPKIFNDRDCLDLLSLTSYLIHKVDQSSRR